MSSARPAFELTLPTDVPLDAVDARIITALASHGRMTWAELGQHVSLSAPAAAERVHRLTARGVVRGYAAIIDAPAVGYALTAFVAVSLGGGTTRSSFLAIVDQTQEILECHHVTGDYDYLLKVRCRDTRDLEQLISLKLKNEGGAAQTRTTIAMSTVKELTFLVSSPRQTPE